MPTYAWSACSVTSVENCAESATTVKPQTSAIVSASPCGTNPIESAQRPETAMQAAVVSGRPTRSPAIPPAMQPSPPAAITAKVTKAASARSA